MFEEFERQRDILLQKEYPTMAGLTNDAFLALISPLRKHLDSLVDLKSDFEKGQLPFVIVIKSTLIPIEQMMEKVNLKGQPGITKLYPLTSNDFENVKDIVIPEQNAYLLVDIDRGQETRNMPPQQALPLIQIAGRSPLTIDEGVAIVTQVPHFLMRNNCFSLLASRHQGDQRVPALWINAAKSPNLGWCWDGNPHTWLGSASCKSRLSL